VVFMCAFFLEGGGEQEPNEGEEREEREGRHDEEEEEEEEEEEGRKTETRQLHRHHQQQRGRHQRRPEDAALVVKVVCPPPRSRGRGRRRRRRGGCSRENFVPLCGRERVETLAAAHEREAEGEDGELQGLVLPRDYGQREQNGVRSKQREDERFLCRQFWGWGGDGGGEG
jgi:hypothetical protein